MNRETQTLLSEVSKTFDVLRGRCGAPKALEYFFDLARKYFGLIETKKRREALIVGTGFPGELLWANHIFPHWVIGGGSAVGSAVDSRVPRDADSISRSMYGYLENYFAAANADKNTPVIVPVNGDNAKKIAYLLQEEGRRVITIDIAPEMKPPRLYGAIAEQICDVISELSFTWKLPGETRKLRHLIQELECAKASISAVAAASGRNVSGMLKLFLLNTYFYAENLSEWALHLDKLAEEMKLCTLQETQASKKPGVLIAGSPILFPNYKVPVLLEDSGLSILGTCDCISGKVLSLGQAPAVGGRRALLQGLVKQTYGNDCSGAFVSNHALYDQASRLLDTLDVQGVIFHIIKGQIEYDFELERMEQLFADRKLPVFRLETDYHDNDVEQLRIRLEAFAELLTQDRCK